MAETTPLIKIRRVRAAGDIEQGTHSRDVSNDSSYSAISDTSVRAAAFVIRGRTASNLPAGNLSNHVPEAREGSLMEPSTSLTSTKRTKQRKIKKGHTEEMVTFALGQIPAVALGAVLNLMWAVPFGVAYFPIEWRSQEMGPPHRGEEIAGGDWGSKFPGLIGSFYLLQFWWALWIFRQVFPLPGKDALGIRIFLFSTLIAQLVFTFSSGFKNPIGMQMIENVPFCHSLAFICIAEQGWGIEAISTLFFIFAASSVLVGAVFFLLGWFQMGNVVYFIPNHVLLGCIAGIGVFIVQVAIEVTIGADFSFFSLQGLQHAVDKFNLLAPVIGFEIILRAIQHFTRLPDWKQRYPLLAPIYFCAVTPISYALLLFVRVDWKDAQALGYFFPSIESSSDGSILSSVFNEDLFDIWRWIKLSTISWTAVGKSIPTLIGLTAFSLIHVPINIPAFAVSTGVDADMNKEIISHGYSNALAGMLGGLQNYLCYSNSMAYAKSNGEGKASSLAVAALTIVLFFIGPNIASYIPCCMAGTLLVHLGIDLFREGACDSYGTYDRLEYFGVWLIIVIMTAFGMSAALVAGAASAVATYAVQSINSQSPVRGAMSAAMLRSSQFMISPHARAILEDKKKGRQKIFIIQLQGHLFFGNVAQLTEEVKQLLKKRDEAKDDVLIVILDFSLVVGIDTSAAQAITKLKKIMHHSFNIALAVFVAGSEAGFPCFFDLDKHLTTYASTGSNQGDEDDASNFEVLSPYRFTPYTVTKKQRKVALLKAIRLSQSSFKNPTPKQCRADKVCKTLDEALIFAEEVLISLENPNLLDRNIVQFEQLKTMSNSRIDTCSTEQQTALWYLSNLCPSRNIHKVKTLFSFFCREVWYKDQALWNQGSKSDSAKLVVAGCLQSVCQGEQEIIETIEVGAMIGEVGLVNGSDRLSTVTCASDEAVVYSLHLSDWSKLEEDNPTIARDMDRIALSFLAHRVQQVSSHMCDTRTLPI